MVLTSDQPCVHSVSLAGYLPRVGLPYSHVRTEPEGGNLHITNEMHIWYLHTEYIIDALSAGSTYAVDPSYNMGPLLLTWFNFNPSMDK